MSVTDFNEKDRQQFPGDMQNRSDPPDQNSLGTTSKPDDSSPFSPTLPPLGSQKAKPIEPPGNYKLKSNDKWNKPNDPLDFMAKTNEFLHHTGIPDLELKAFDVVAARKNEEYLRDNFRQQMNKGVGPWSFIGKVIQAEHDERQRAIDFQAEQAKKRQEMAQAEKDRLDNPWEHPDKSPLNKAWKDYSDALKKAPEAAPILAKAHIGDPEAIIGLATVLLGGLGVAPHVLQGLNMGAQRVADQKNADNQIEYQNRVNAQNAKKESLRIDYLKQDQDYKDLDQQRLEEHNQRENKIKMRELGIEADADQLAAMEKATSQAMSDIYELYPKSSDWNTDTRKLLQEKANKIATDYAKPGSSQEEIDTQASRIFAFMNQQATNNLKVVKGKEAEAERIKAEGDKKYAEANKYKGKIFAYAPQPIALLDNRRKKRSLADRQLDAEIQVERQMQDFVNGGGTITPAEQYRAKKMALEAVNAPPPKPPSNGANTKPGK